MSDNTNTLNELNSILFNTLRGLSSGDIDHKQAQAVVSVGTAITNNAKVQLTAFKITGGMTPVEALGHTEEHVKSQKALGMSRGDAALAFAKEQGHKNVAAAMAAMGNTEFNRAVTNYMKG